MSRLNANWVTQPPSLQPMNLREATVADAEALAHFAAEAFWDTYREISDAQDIADYVASHLCRDVIAEVLLDPKSTTLLAEAGAVIAGYAVLRQVDSPPCVSGSEPIKLERFYLGNAFIGHGYGARFLMAVQALAWHLGARTMWLGVYDRNVRAVRFYERAGFVKVGGDAFLFGGKIYIDPVYATAIRNDSE